MIVVEIFFGGGWYVDIFYFVVKDNGKYVVVYFYVDDEISGYFKKLVEDFKEKMKLGMKYEGVEFIVFDLIKVLDISEVGSVDMVLMFCNVYNWYMCYGDEGVDNVFGVFFKVFKLGGVLGVVEYEFFESVDDEVMKKSGYMKCFYVVVVVEKVGFVFEVSSDVNVNLMDIVDYLKGVWMLFLCLVLDD